jgi:hypothetical protein
LLRLKWHETTGDYDRDFVRIKKDALQQCSNSAAAMARAPHAVEFQRSWRSPISEASIITIAERRPRPLTAVIERPAGGFAESRGAAKPSLCPKSA